MNLVSGTNGQGKTNLLESLFYGCTGKSMRVAGDRELIHFEQNTAALEVKAFRNASPLEIKIQFNRRGGKQIFLNGRKLSRLSDFLGKLNAVSFSPEDIDIIRGEPAGRRSALDMLLSQTNNVYLHALQRYRYFLHQRNYLLRRKQPYDEILLETYTEELVKYGTVITELRASSMEYLSGVSGGFFKTLTEEFGTLCMKYRYSYDRSAPVAEDLRAAYKQTADKEIIMGTTLTGPHRDDYQILLGDVQLRKYGSQGQCRAAAAAVKLSFVEHIKKECGAHPILLLDDIFSDLDDKLCHNLRELFSGGFQVFFAAPFFKEIPVDCFYLTVQKGNVKLEKKK